jgi:DNA-nicking Smr family endonuclease
MATPKRTSEPSPKSRPASRSLRDQMAALAPQVVAAAAARAPPPPSPPKPAQPSGSEAFSFKDLAGAGGVRPLPDPSRAAPRSEPPPGNPLPEPPRPAPSKHRLWVERRDDVVRARAEDVPPRWLDDLRAGRVVPRRELDLHRRGAADARQALDDEVARARWENVGCVLIVCGRGLHSGLYGPVLPDVAIERLSEELSEHVFAFCSAPRKWGGEGALIVMLRPPTRQA